MLTWFDISFSLPVPAILVRIVVWITLLCRHIKYGYAFRRIKLTQGYFALIDPADYQRLSRYNWRLCRTKGKNTLYAERSIRLPNGKYSRILMHREIMENTLSASSTQNSKLKTQNLKFHSTFDIIRAANNGLLPDQVMFTFHPQRWTDKPLPWTKELVMQNIKNVVKRLMLNVKF